MGVGWADPSQLLPNGLDAPFGKPFPFKKPLVQFPAEQEGEQDSEDEKKCHVNVLFTCVRQSGLKGYVQYVERLVPVAVTDATSCAD